MNPWHHVEFIIVYVSIPYMILITNFNIPLRIVDAATSNGEAWACGKVLRIGEDEFEIVYNPPTIQKVRMEYLLKPQGTMSHDVEGVASKE